MSNKLPNVRRLQATDYLLLATDKVSRDDMKWAILETREGQFEVWSRFDMESDKSPTDPERGIIVIGGEPFEFERDVTQDEARGLVRQWEGHEPDENVEPVGVPETMAPPVPEKMWPPGELSILRMMEELAEKSGVALNDENRAFWQEKALGRLERMHSASTLDVPELPPAQEVHIGGRNRETGEWEVSHAYHDLHAPDGETVTQRMGMKAHRVMAGTIANLTRLDTPAEVALKTVAATVFAGQMYDWDNVQELAEVYLTGTGGGRWGSYLPETICTVMAQEQRNDPQHGWKLEWPDVHLATTPEGLGAAELNPLVAFCGDPDPEDGSLLWILPIRFKQSGPVPFGPMCKRCVAALEGMKDDDPRLVPREKREELVSEETVRQWVEEERADDLMREYVPEPDPYRDHDEN